MKADHFDEEMLPNFEPPDPPLSQLIEFVDREIAYRRKMYPFRVAQGRMKSAYAFRQIQLMEAVRAKLEGLQASQKRK